MSIILRIFSTILFHSTLFVILIHFHIYGSYFLIFTTVWYSEYIENLFIFLLIFSLFHFVITNNATYCY